MKISVELETFASLLLKMFWLGQRNARGSANHQGEENPTPGVALSLADSEGEGGMLAIQSLCNTVSNSPGDYLDD
jgi:hypothetical protein